MEIQEKWKQLPPNFSLQQNKIVLQQKKKIEKLKKIVSKAFQVQPKSK
jgi:hypothetical protein